MDFCLEICHIVICYFLLIHLFPCKCFHNFVCKVPIYTLIWQQRNVGCGCLRRGYATMSDLPKSRDAGKGKGVSGSRSLLCWPPGGVVVVVVVVIVEVAHLRDSKSSLYIFIWKLLFQASALTICFWVLNDFYWLDALINNFTLL